MSTFPIIVGAPVGTEQATISPVYITTPRDWGQWSLNIAGSMSAPLYLPVTRTAGYAANYYFANAIADPMALVRAYWGDKLTGAELQELLWWHGIPWESWQDLDDNDTRKLRKSWEGIIELARPTFEPDVLLRRHWQGADLEVSIKDSMTRRGMFRPEDHALFMSQYVNLPIAIAYRLWLAGKLGFGNNSNDDVFDALLKAHGFQREQDREAFRTVSEYPSPLETNLLVNRRFLTPAQGRDFYKSSGVTAVAAARAFEELRNEIPGPSDLVRFALREVWNPDVVDEYGYDEEFPPAFQAWMERQGFGWEEQITSGDGTVIPALSWARAYWRAHWQNIAPTQAYQAFHKLRPNRIWKYAETYPELRPFVLQDLNAVLKINDYPPAYRDWLAAINHTPLRLADIRAAFNLGRSNPAFVERLTGDQVRNVAEAEQSAYAWSVEEMLDRGSTRADAEAQSLIFLESARQKETGRALARERRYREKAGTTALEQFGLGVLTELQVRDVLSDLGWTNRTIGLAVADVNATEKSKLIASVKSRIRKDFFAGKLAAPEAKERLQRLGLDPLRVDETIAYWQAEFTDRRKELSTSQIVENVSKGWLPFASGLARLRNIGWSQADALLWIAKANEGLVKRQAAIVKADLAARRTAAKELLAAGKAAAKQVDDIQSALRRIMPVAHLQKALKAGHLTEQHFNERMTASGYPPEATRLYALEVLNGQSSKPAKGKGKATEADSASGTE